MSEILLSLLSRVDGSCSIRSKDVDIISSVAGPMEAKSRQELPQQVLLELLISPAVGPSSTREKLLEDQIKKILNRVINTYQYPRQLIQVVMQVLKNDKVPIKEMMYIINSVYLSLIDSGISLNCSFLATCCILTPESQIKFEFTKEEFDVNQGSFLVVYTLHNGQCDELILLESNGDNISLELINRVLELSRNEINTVNTKIRGIIEAKIEKDYIWNL